MDYKMFLNFAYQLIKEFASFGEFLTTKLPYINITPLAIFSVTGISAILVFVVMRLVVGG